MPLRNYTRTIASCLVAGLLLSASISSAKDKTPKKWSLKKKVGLAVVGGMAMFATGGLANLFLSSNQPLDVSRNTMLYDANCSLCSRSSAALKFFEGGVKTVTLGLFPKKLTARVSIHNDKLYDHPAVKGVLKKEETCKDLHMLVPNGKEGVRVVIGGELGPEIAKNFRVPETIAESNWFKTKSNQLYKAGSNKRKQIKSREALKNKQRNSGLPGRTLPPRPQKRGG